MKQVTINIPDHMDAETAEFLVNYESYLTIKGEYPYQRICSNAKRLCYKCQQPQCDFAGVKFPLTNADKQVTEK